MTANAADAPAPKPAPAIGGKHDTKAPIEITSDTLEVFQKENKAIFTGHVIAIQNEIRLKSDKMTVYYHQKSDAETPKKTAQEKSNNPVESSAIDRIDVDGNVFMATPTETASGDNGIYNVVNHTIDLYKNVVLTRDKNVLKGDKLNYNLETGKSVLNGETTNAETAKPADGKQRVHALFVPNKEETPKAPAGATAAPAASVPPAAGEPAAAVAAPAVTAPVAPVTPAPATPPAVTGDKK